MASFTSRNGSKKFHWSFLFSRSKVAGEVDQRSRSFRTGTGRSNESGQPRDRRHLEPGSVLPVQVIPGGRFRPASEERLQGHEAEVRRL